MTIFPDGKDETTLLIRAEIDTSSLDLNLVMHGKFTDSNCVPWDGSHLQEL